MQGQKHSLPDLREADSIEASTKKIAAIMGGKSSVREVSFSSGQCVMSALEELGYAIEMVDPATYVGIRRLADGGFDCAFLCLHGAYGEDGCIKGHLDLIGLPYTSSDVLGSALAINKAMAKVI